MTERLRQPTAFPSGQEIRDMLPDNTAVTPDEADDEIVGTVGRLEFCHGENPLPLNRYTHSLVRQMAYAKMLKLHYTKGEAAIQTPTADLLITNANNEITAYCTAVQAGLLGPDGEPEGGEAAEVFNISEDSLWGDRWRVGVPRGRPDDSY